MTSKDGDGRDFVETATATELETETETETAPVLDYPETSRWLTHESRSS